MKAKEESQAPAEKTSSYFQTRVTREDDPVKIMTKLWEKKNTRDAFLNGGLIPLDFATHTCNKWCERKGNDVEHHFEMTDKLDDRDVAVAMATVQWLATNCGRGFLTEFFRELKIRVEY